MNSEKYHVYIFIKIMNSEKYHPYKLMGIGKYNKKELICSNVKNKATCEYLINKNSVNDIFTINSGEIFIP